MHDHRLLRDENGITGAMGYWRESGRPIIFRAKAVVLATGGIGRCFRVTSNSWEYTGDGHALAYLAGADLIDMEFMQFHPTGMVWPPSVRGILVTEGVRGEGGVLKNSGRALHVQVDPRLAKADTADNEAEGDRWLAGDKTARRVPELLTRDHVARCIVREVKEGRGSRTAACSWTSPRAGLRPTSRRSCRRCTTSSKSSAASTSPKSRWKSARRRTTSWAASASMPRRRWRPCRVCSQPVKSPAGLHGANRLGGNSLSDLLVFGRRAGLGASSYARGIKAIPQTDDAQVERIVKEMYEPFDRPSAENAFTVTSDLQTTMEANVGIARVQNELEKALRDIASLKERAKKVSVVGDCRYNPGWHQVLDLNNLLICAEALTMAALSRKESRGGHMRIDFPDSVTEEGKWNNVLRRGSEGQMVLVKQTLPEMPAELHALAHDEKARSNKRP